MAVKVSRVGVYGTGHGSVCRQDEPNGSVDRTFMTRKTSDDSDQVESARADLEMAAISDPYKVLGDIDDDSGIGVLGRNTATSGFTKGVEGRVSSPAGYGLYTPDDARVDGTLRASTTYTDQLGTGTADPLALANDINANSVTISNLGQLSVSTVDNGGNSISLGDNVDANGNKLVDDTGSVTVDDDTEITGNVDVSGAQSVGNLGANAGKISDQSVSGNFSRTTVVFENKFQDDRDEYNNTTGVFTCSRDGAYQVDTCVVVENTDLNTGDRVFMEIVTSGSFTAAPRVKHSHHSDIIGDVYLSLSKVVRGLSSNDTIEVEVSTDSSGGMTVKGDYRTYFTVTQIG